MRATDYRERFYREWTQAKDLLTFRVQCDETDIQVSAKPIGSATDLINRTRKLVYTYRNQIKEIIERHPQFLHSLNPLTLETKYEITCRMIEKSSLAGVGPMATVAGAIAEHVGQKLLPITEELIVENGGDLFMNSRRDRTVLIYAGENSPFSNKLRLRFRGRETPIGICTSSKHIGHSVSFGDTDVSLVIAGSAITADAFATAVGNMVKRDGDIPSAIEFARRCPEIEGGLIMIGDRLGAWGTVELV